MTVLWALEGLEGTGAGGGSSGDLSVDAEAIVVRSFDGAASL